MKKLFAKIFEPKQEEIQQPKWSFERNGWEASARKYNQKHNLKVDKV